MKWDVFIPTVTPGHFLGLDLGLGFFIFQEIRSKLFRSSLFLTAEQQCGGCSKSLYITGLEPK